MNFFIKKNSTLPILKVEVFKDGRTSYKEFDKLLSASTITFSMKNSDTDVYVILDSPATLDIIKDTDGQTVRYLLSYQLSKKYTKKIGEFIGEFKIDNYQGEAILPIRKTLYVNVIESFSLTDLCCKPNVPPPRPTGTPLPSLTPTPSNPPQIQCDGSISASGGRGYYTVDAQLGTDVGTVTVEFESYNIPDRFMIYWDNQIVADSLFIGDSLINNYNQYGPEILNTTSLPKKQWDGSNFVNVGTEYVSFTTDDITNCSFTRFQANTQPKQIGVNPNFPAPTVNNCEGRVKLSFFKPTAFPTNISIVVIGCNANTGWDLVNLQCPVALTPTPTVTPSTTPNYFLECASVIKDFYLECGSGVIELSPTPTPSPTSTPNFQPPTGIYTVFARFNLFNPIPTLTPTPSITSTVTPTISLTPSITPSISLTPTLTPTNSTTPTLTPTQTPTNTPTVTPTKPQYVMDCYTEFGVFEVTPTPTISITPTLTPTNTPTNSPTPSITSTITATVTPTTSITPTPSITSTIPSTPSVTPTNTVTPTQTQTPTITPTNTVTSSQTPTPTVTPTNIQIVDVNFGVIFESGSTKGTFFITASQPVAGNLQIDFANTIYDRFDGTEVRSTVRVIITKGQISGSTTIINGYDYDRIEPYQTSYDKINITSTDVVVNNINKYSFVEFRGKTKPTEVNYQFISCCGTEFKDLIVAPTSQWVVDGYGVFIDNTCFIPFKQGGTGSDGYYYGPDFKTCSDKICPSCSTSTPTPTPTPTTTSISKITPTPTPTSTIISKITPTPTNTPTTSITQTLSVTPTQTQTPTITTTPTQSITSTPSISPTQTLTPTITPTSSITLTPTNTPTTSTTQTPTITPTQTQTPTVTVTSGLSPTPTPSNTPTPSITSSITPTQTPTITPTSTQTQTPTNTPTTSITQTPTPSITSTPSITPTQTQTPTITTTPTITPTSSITSTPSITPTSSMTPTQTQTPTITTTPTNTPTSSITSTPSITPTQTPTNTTTPSVTPTEQVLPVSGYYFYYDPGDKNSYNGTGTTLRDLSGNENNAFIANGPSHTSGEGGYFTLDGVNEYILSPSIFDGSNESHTLEVWVYLNSFDNCIWSDLGQTIINDSYHFAGSQVYAIGQANYVITSLWDSTSVFKVDNYTGTTSPLGKWQQIVRVYDGTRLYSYRNGSLTNFATVSFDSPYNDGLSDWRIAFGAEDSTTYSTTTANFLDGRYGVIRYYQSALNATEILQNYNSDKSKYGL